MIGVGAGGNGGMMHSNIIIIIITAGYIWDSVVLLSVVGVSDKDDNDNDDS
jgi:hypothetical protein